MPLTSRDKFYHVNIGLALGGRVEIAYIAANTCRHQGVKMKVILQRLEKSSWNDIFVFYVTIGYQMKTFEKVYKSLRVEIHCLYGVIF